MPSTVDQSDVAQESEVAGAGPTAQTPPGGGGGGSAVGEALSALFRVIARRGRQELGRAASQGRVRLDLRQLRRDRDEMYRKLGREARTLYEGGELDHPGIQRGAERIADLDLRISEVEAGLQSAPSEEVDEKPTQSEP